MISQVRHRALVGVLAVLATAPTPWSPATAQEVAALRSDISDLLNTYRWPDARWGVLVVSLDRGDTLFALSQDSVLTPASNVKLLTTAAALETLGPDYRFRTYLLTDGDVVDGVVRGDLVLYGTGDPGISDRFYGSKSDVFHQLIDQLTESGVHAVTGDLVADASFLPGPIRPGGWNQRDLNDRFTAPVSALSFNENVVSFRVEASDGLGEPPVVSTIPDNAGLDIVNRAETVAGRARPRLAILRDDPLDPIRVEGRMTRGARDVWRQMTVPSPPRFAISVFRSVLEERGVVVYGSTRIVKSPAASVVGRVSAPSRDQRGARVLARHVSEPLRLYLDVINKESNNLFAELVFRMLGRVSEGVGSPEAAARAVRASLERLSANVEGLIQLDGSGLSEGNRVSPSIFVDLLARMSDSPLWTDYWASLPEAGRRRELGRMYRTPAAGNLRAKTGTIEGVSALSGLVRSADGERLAFSLLLNDTPSTTRAKRIENLIGTRLASFTRGPGRAPPTRVAEASRPAPDAAGGPSRHKVRSGENLTFIARRYGLTVDDLLQANPRIQPNRILAGQWLAIPQQGGGD